MKRFLVALAAMVLLRTVAVGQITLPLAFTNSFTVQPVNYPTGMYGVLSMQTTTNLGHPTVWHDVSASTQAGLLTVNNTGPQQFYRIRPLLPIFQFAIFYNVNLEIDPGAAMTISGPVFCNQNIWEGSSVCTFATTVMAAGTNYAQIADPFATAYIGSGASTFAGAQPASHVPPLALIGVGTDLSPTNMRSLLALPPPAYAMGTASAYSSNGMVYPANGADLVVTNGALGTNFGLKLPTGTNIIVYFQDASLTRLPYDYYIITNGNTHSTFFTNYVSPTLLGPGTNIYFAGFSWVTNVAFYDWREGWNDGSGPPKRVEAVPIDMAKLKAWLVNAGNNGGAPKDALKLLHAGRHIDSIYVYSRVALTARQLPAVRVMNGGGLPQPGGSNSGMTVATPLPLYVWGDYNATNNTGSSLGSTNTAHTVPAALMGDSITVLSDSWSDANTNKMPSPSATTVNAAMLVGIVPSNIAISGNYSGGMENFVRLLENWSGNTLTYNGSIVVPFYSQYATNHWQPSGNYYNPAMRNWNFDANFKNAAKLPPLTPVVENYVTP